MSDDIVVRLDNKGRIVIPLKVRKELKIRNLVRMRVEGDRAVLTGVEDPVEAIAATVVKGTKDVEKEISGLRYVAEKELLKKSVSAS